MKSFMIIAVGLFFCVSTLAQNSANDDLKKDNPFIRFEPSKIEIGTITTEDITPDLGNLEIKVHNDGELPLILNRVTACCGTRVNEWPSEPIAPSKEGTIKVSFRVAPRPHRISRTITVFSNAANGNMLRIPIRGEVVQPSGGDNEIQLR